MFILLFRACTCKDLGLLEGIVSYLLTFTENICVSATERSEKPNICELRDLIGLKMPQLNEALSPSTSSSQVTWKFFHILLLF